MNIEDIKVGETYNVRVKINGYNLAKTAVKVWDCSGFPCYFKLEEVSPVSPPPKYDPCRLFREGDIVTTRARDGRSPWGTLSLCLPHESKINLSEKREYMVTRNEERGNVRIYPIIDMPGIDTTNITIDACYLELVHPVEEIAPYRTFDNKSIHAWTVLKNGLIFAYYPYRINESDNIVHSKEEAQAAATAECERLNAKASFALMDAEYRKEQEK